jgi:type II secretory pathway pseudopilin PulG
MNTNEQMNKNRRNANQGQSGERGYALVGLMAVMMFALILTTTTAPTLQREMQREKEEEMLWRGQQVAVALSRYRAFRGGAFPTTLKELVEGINLNGKRLHLLRSSAICDPMTPCEDETNWRTVNPGDPLTKELLEAIIGSQEKSKIPLNPQGIQELARFAQVGTVTLPGQPADTKLDGVIGPGENQQGGSASGDNTQGAPIIGVVSRRSGKMFRSYYGIEEYDHALFFPNIPVMAGGFISPFTLSGAIPGGGVPGGVPGRVPGGVPGGAPAARDPRCPAGGTFVNGRCVGAPSPIN